MEEGLRPEALAWPVAGADLVTMVPSLTQVPGEEALVDVMSEAARALAHASR